MMEMKDGIPKQLLAAMNQLYELEKKVEKHGNPSNFERNIGKMKDAFEHFHEPDGGFKYEDPMGQRFTETRTDLEATISGKDTQDLVVVEVIKPIIRFVSHDSLGSYSKVVQKGIVLVESRKEGEKP